jgi:hypothetical protein
MTGQWSRDFLTSSMVAGLYLTIGFLSKSVALLQVVLSERSG